jgi:oligopeptide/dipeptide ABC transporter ATP-binding protein
MSDRTPVLEARDLEIEYRTRDGSVRSLDGATLNVAPGEITAIVGESGSGKTTFGLAAGRLLAANAVHVGGDLRVLGENVLRCDPDRLQTIRREALGFIFQDPVAALNPTLPVQRQLQLAASLGGQVQTPAQALDDVGLPDIARVLRSYPHELSGGMAQRVGIALALLRRPRLLIADEPTAAVDATRRAQILELLVARCREQKCALLLLTHDLHTVATWCTRIAVMYGGRVVEAGPTVHVLTRPKHPYTRALVSALPGDERQGERLQAIPGVPPVLHDRSAGCAFAARCPEVLEQCPTVRPRDITSDGRQVCCHLLSEDLSSAGGSAHTAAATRGAVISLVADRSSNAFGAQRTPRVKREARTPVVSVQDLAVTYRRGRRAGAADVHALSGITLEIFAGETVGLVGESGAGKTTLGRALLGLLEPSAGDARLGGQPLTGRGSAQRLRGRLQVVPQNPDWSLDPHLRVWRSVAEPLDVVGTIRARERRAAVDRMLAGVGLSPSIGERLPHQLSGGQRQRVAIARAVVADPDLIVFDEAVTALDASVQTQVLNLIRDLQEERGFAALFISHDLAAVRYVSHRIAVAYGGRIVEISPAARFYAIPDHDYSRQLVAAVSSLARLTAPELTDRALSPASAALHPGRSE